MSEASDYALGERRREQCRFGVFSGEAFRVDAATGCETPIVMPLCAWQPSEAWPPALARQWGGSVEFARDCAVCACFKEIARNE